jgi:hypothetical protein
MKTNKYWHIVATLNGQEEKLYGSFDKADCLDELECEKDSWKADGYKKIKLVSCQTNEKPDPQVYENFVNGCDLTNYINTLGEGEIKDYIEDGLISQSADGYFINDQSLLSDYNVYTNK